jgi:hypothetical protein
MMIWEYQFLDRLGGFRWRSGFNACSQKNAKLFGVDLRRDAFTIEQ